MTNEAETSTPQRRFSAFRHHKQRFDEGAKFIWRKRLKLGADPKTGETIWSRPGASVDLSVFRFGMARKFWNQNTIELADWTPPGKRAPIGANCDVELAVAGRGHYTLTLVEWSDMQLSEAATDDGDSLPMATHVYKPRGLGNLRKKAAALGVGKTVDEMLAMIKENEREGADKDKSKAAIAAQPTNEEQSAARVEESGTDAGEGDALASSVDAPLDGGGAEVESGEPAISDEAHPDLQADELAFGEGDAQPSDNEADEPF